MPSALPKIKLDAFEGPFDLLLELARQRKVDLTEVSLGEITGDFLAYVSKWGVVAELQADFLVVAATLVLLKIKHVLPTLTPEEEEEITELTDRVRLYQLYRQQAAELHERWQNEPLLPGPEQLRLTMTAPWPEVTAVDVMEFWESALNRIRIPAPPTRHLRRQGISVAHCVTFLRNRLKRAVALGLTDVIADIGKPAASASFLAALELARSREVQLEQHELFSPITITAAHD